MPISLGKSVGKLGGRSGKIAGTFVGEGPGKGQTRVEGQQSRMDLNKKVAVEVMVPPGNTQPVVLVKLMVLLPSPTYMVVRVVVPVNGWGPCRRWCNILGSTRRWKSDNSAGVTVSANGSKNNQAETNDRNGGGGSGGSLRL